MNRAAEHEARYEIAVVGNIVEEIKTLVEQLRIVLVTRNRGLPDDLFLICADDTYFQQEITEVRARYFARNVNMLRQLYGPVVPDLPTSLTITRTGVLTQAQIIRAFHAEGKKFVENPEKWLHDHKGDIIRGVAFVVMISALGAAVILTVGLAAPAIPIAEGALVGAGTTVATGTAAVVGEGAALTTVGTGMVVTESVGLTVETAGLTQAQQTALRWDIGAAQSQARLALGSRAASSAAISDGLLSQVGRTSTSVINELSMNSIMIPMGLGNDQLKEINQIANSATLKHWYDAVTEVGRRLQRMSSHHIVAEGKVPDSVMLGLGKLYLLKLRSINSANNLPPLESDFDPAAYSDDLKPIPGGREQPPKRLRYLGMIRCK